MHCPGVYQAAYQSHLHVRLLSATIPPPETHVKNLTGWGVVLGGEQVSSAGAGSSHGMPKRGSPRITGGYLAPMV